METMEIFTNLVVALLLGVLIGLERQWRQKPAGLRTNTLVALGSAGFVSLSLLVHYVSPLHILHHSSLRVPSEQNLFC